MDQAAMKSLVERYVVRHTAKDLEGVMECFAADAEVWDPADGEPFIGTEAIRGFFGGTHDMAEEFNLALTGPIACCGPYAAFTMTARVKIGDLRTEIDIVEVMTMNDAGLVADMRAYWSAEDMRIG